MAEGSVHFTAAGLGGSFIRPSGIARSFSSFRALKRGLGPAGSGKVWHHIVEQSKVEQFGAEAIHNSANVVAVSPELNNALNALYSSIRPRITGSTTLRVRDWLRTQSYEANREFGLRALENVQRGVWP